MTRDLAGAFVVLITPFDSNQVQDHESLRKLVRYNLKAGVDGFTALGEVSESPKMSDREREENLATIFDEVKGKVPVIVGASRESTDLALDAAKFAEKMGAAAVMIAPPKSLKLREDAIFNHFAAISDSINIPIVIQDEPESDHPYMSVQLLARLGDKIKHSRYVKLEDPPTPIKISKLTQLVGNTMRIFGASHGRSYLWELDRGAVGIMTASPTPEYLVAIWKAFKNGNRDIAKKIFFYNLPISHYYGEMALAVKKEVLVHRGVIKTATMKQPAGDIGDSGRRDLIELLKWTEEGVLQSTGISPLDPS
ncbi:MAG: dihydrodipicolinate synthase family protein [Nitrososphaerales archaeon]